MSSVLGTMKAAQQGGRHRVQPLSIFPPTSHDAMNQKAFTIHTQLIDGSLAGARNIYMGANRTCHLYVLPRNEVSLANSIKDISDQRILSVGRE